MSCTESKELSSKCSWNSPVWTHTHNEPIYSHSFASVASENILWRRKKKKNFLWASHASPKLISSRSKMSASNGCITVCQMAALPLVARERVHLKLPDLWKQYLIFMASNLGHNGPSSLRQKVLSCSGAQQQHYWTHLTLANFSSFVLCFCFPFVFACFLSVA